MSELNACVAAFTVISSDQIPQASFPADLPDGGGGAAESGPRDSDDTGGLQDSGGGSAQAEVGGRFSS